jgi:hypothetical protein
VNITAIRFTSTELSLLNKGPRYNLHHTPDNWIRSLAWEAETPASHLPIPQQEYMRQRIAHAIEKLYKQQQIAPSTRLTRQHHEHLLTKQIRRKLNNHHAVVTRADKGNSLYYIRPIIMTKSSPSWMIMASPFSHEILQTNSKTTWGNPSVPAKPPFHKTPNGSSST